MARGATATINLTALRHNYLLAKQCKADSKAVAIIKADGYGHGAIEVGKALDPIADALGVACIEEAMELREAGITSPILLLEGFFAAEELADICQHNMWCVVHNLEQIDIIAQTQLAKPLTIWLKMDTGMHRLGISPQAYQAAFDTLNALEQVDNIVLMTHFACADDLASSFTAEQIALFDASTMAIEAPTSLANSAATLAHSAALRTWQRPGIMLYGASPFEYDQALASQLHTVMTLTAKITAIRDLQVGERIGYGGTWLCEKPTRVGTIALGYADGYPRHAKNGTPVMVNGQRSSIIGRVSMDMMTIDLTHLADAKIGDDVELWGENINATEVAAYCDTISYTLFTGITKRVEKKYI